jgi:hypothetical protein
MMMKFNWLHLGGLLWYSMEFTLLYTKDVGGSSGIPAETIGIFYQILFG